MSLKQLIILFVFSFSMMIFAGNVSAITGNWLVCGNTECPGCSSANWDNCVWDGYNQYCPSSCNGGYSSGLSSSYGCYDDWDCPWDYYCSGGSCVYSGNSYYGGYECYDDWDWPNGYYFSGGSCMYSSYYDYYSTWDDCYY